MKKALLTSLLIISAFVSCQKVFLNKATLSSYTDYSTTSNQLSFYKIHHKINESGNVRITTHLVFKVGTKIQTLPDYLYVRDGSYWKCKKFYARIKIQMVKKKNLIT